VNRNTFGQYLLELRKKKKLTTRELADISNVSQSYISHVENGRKGIPSPDVLKKLFMPLGVTYLELMERAGHLPISLNHTEYYHGEDLERQIFVNGILKYPTLLAQFIKESGISGLDSITDPHSLFDAITPDQRLYFCLRLTKYTLGETIPYPYYESKPFNWSEYEKQLDTTVDLTHHGDDIPFKIYVDGVQLTQKELKRVIATVRMERQLESK
jgi:transcriptional regulator with XRE-family HTH domain